jgi:hypothetical protein
MILHDKTQEKFGYSINALSEGSKKYVCIECDYCHEQYDAQYKNRNNSYKKLPKDCCSKCKFKKREEVSLQNHGVKNSAQRPEVRKKIADSGWIKSEEFAQKRKESMLEKYGVEHPIQSPEIAQKIKNTNISKYGCENPMMNTSIKEVSIENSVKTKIEDGSILRADGCKIDTFTTINNISKNKFYKECEKTDFNTAIRKFKKLTSIEKKIVDFLDSKSINYQLGFNIANFWPDIKIGNLLVECDGIFWHSDEYLHSNYHFNKKKVYTKFSFESLFFRSDEIIHKFDIVKSILLKRLSMIKELESNDLRPIDFDTAFDFMKDNHLAGSSGTTSFSYGIFQDNNLLSAIQFKKNNSDDNYRVSRYCDHKDFIIKDSFSLFINRFISDIKFKSLIRYVDLRYEKMNDSNFLEVGCLPSFKWTDGSKTYHRMRFPGNSGYDHGLAKIFDCGQAKYVLA